MKKWGSVAKRGFSNKSNRGAMQFETLVPRHVKSAWAQPWNAWTKEARAGWKVYNTNNKVCGCGKAAMRCWKNKGWCKQCYEKGVVLG